MYHIISNWNGGARIEIDYILCKMKMIKTRNVTKNGKFLEMKMIFSKKWEGDQNGNKITSSSNPDSMQSWLVLV